MRQFEVTLSVFRREVWAELIVNTAETPCGYQGNVILFTGVPENGRFVGSEKQSCSKIQLQHTVVQYN